MVETYWAISMLGDPNQACAIGGLGCVAAMVFANLGAAFGTAKSGVAILETTSIKPELVFKAIIPVVMAGILGMYGLIICIIIKQSSKYYYFFAKLVRVFLSQFNTGCRLEHTRIVVVQLRQGIRTPWLRTLCWPFRLSFGLCHWYLRRCWRARLASRRHPDRGYPHDDLRRSYCTFRLHCRRCPRTNMIFEDIHLIHHFNKFEISLFYITLST